MEEVGGVRRANEPASIKTKTSELSGMIVIDCEII